MISVTASKKRIVIALNIKEYKVLFRPESDIFFMKKISSIILISSEMYWKKISKDFPEIFFKNFVKMKISNYSKVNLIKKQSRIFTKKQKHKYSSIISFHS